MLTMQPLMLIADGTDSFGSQVYRVLFELEGAQVEHLFTVSEGTIVSVRGDDEFLKATVRDPLAPALYQAVLNFHEARRIVTK
ncbi:MAG: hypothetical protein Q8T09_13815 [Candidatus Melainabacteria bacterium]|jgi:hypothetical protein|nr:hypothetical protein [Candidatus Melainabacteria bacterium]